MRMLGLPLNKVYCGYNAPILDNSKLGPEATNPTWSLRMLFSARTLVCQSYLAKTSRCAPLGLYMSAHITTLAVRVGNALTEPQKQSSARLLARRGIALGHLKRYILLMTCIGLPTSYVLGEAVVTSNVVIVVTSNCYIKQWLICWYNVASCWPVVQSSCS